MTIRMSIRGLAPVLALAVSLGASGTALAGTSTDNSAMAHKTAHKTTHRAPLPGYKTLSQAKTSCGAGPIVWHARGSKVFHSQGSKYFGKTKHGAYVCEKTAEAHGLHRSKY